MYLGYIYFLDHNPAYYISNNILCIFIIYACYLLVVEFFRSKNDLYDKCCFFTHKLAYFTVIIEIALRERINLLNKAQY